MLEGLDKTAGGIGEAVKTVPELYQDVLQPTVQETGKFVARIPRAINAAFSSLDKWILNKEYSIEETKKLLAKKLENIADDKIVEPEPYVAVPAIQAISYSMNSEELRNLYANLLAKSMNIDTKDSVHPAFVEIIRQFSPVDALVFKIIMEREINPLIDLVYRNDQNELLSIISNVSDIKVAPIETICMSIDNLVKQSLISIPMNNYYANQYLYDKLLCTDYYLTQRQQHPDTADGFKFTYLKRQINKTNLGLSFYKVCIIDL